MKDGKLEGDYKYYWKSGTLFREGTFYKDRDHGKSIRYHENGKVWIEKLTNKEKWMEMSGNSIPKEN